MDDGRDQADTTVDDPARERDGLDRTMVVLRFCLWGPAIGLSVFMLTGGFLFFLFLPLPGIAGMLAARILVVGAILGCPPALATGLVAAATGRNRWILTWIAGWAFTTAWIAVLDALRGISPKDALVGLPYVVMITTPASLLCLAISDAAERRADGRWGTTSP